MSLFKGIKIWDTVASAYSGLAFRGGAPQICSQDYLQCIAEGDISGHVPFEKMGFANAPASEIDVWCGNVAYVFPTAAAAMRCVSSSTSDAAAGTGAKTVRIWYLKDDYTEATTDVILTGTTPVNTTVSDIFRVNAFRVVDFGATSTTYRAIGNIDVYHASAATIYSRINASWTRARNSIYTVPEGKTMYITSMTAGSTKPTTSSNGAYFIFRATYDAKLGALTPGLHFVPHAEFNLIDQMIYRPFEMPIVLPEHTDIKMSVIAGQASTSASCTYRGWLE